MAERRTVVKGPGVMDTLIVCDTVLRVGAQGRFTSPDPGNAGAVRENPQSWNMYAYVLNNPLKLVDPNGKWPTYIHNRIIGDALPGLSRQQQQILRTASHDMDYVVRMNNRDPQDPANSYLHGMSDGTVNQDRGQARRDADAFIADQERLAQNQQAEYEKAGGNGLSPDALRTFGLALHTVTDRTSPAHQGEQPWNGTEGAANSAAAANHVRRELVIDSNAGAQAVGVARGFFQRVFGAAATRQATTPPPPPPPKRPLDDK